MWSRVRQGIVNWATAMASSLTLNYFSKTDWRLPNAFEGYTLFNYGASTSPLNYVPFNTNLVDTYYWTGTTNPSNTAAAVLMGMQIWTMTIFSKTTSQRWIAVRTANISEL
jgi:hypothetical protein